MTRNAAMAAALLTWAAAACCGTAAKEPPMTHPDPLSASRAAPPRVPPVFIDGVRYAQVFGNVDDDGQVGGILAAYDGGNRELWRLRVYENARNPDLEGDVQDVFFRSMRAEHGKLQIENENGQRFEVDPASRQVAGNGSAPRPANADIDPISGKPFIQLPTKK